MTSSVRTWPVLAKVNVPAIKLKQCSENNSNFYLFALFSKLRIGRKKYLWSFWKCKVWSEKSEKPDSNGKVKKVKPKVNHFLKVSETPKCTFHSPLVKTFVLLKNHFRKIDPSFKRIVGHYIPGCPFKDLFIYLSSMSTSILSLPLSDCGIKWISNN